MNIQEQIIILFDLSVYVFMICNLLNISLVFFYFFETLWVLALRFPLTADQHYIEFACSFNPQFVSCFPRSLPYARRWGERRFNTFTG
jgi:hypothetical protein